MIPPKIPYYVMPGLKRSYSLTKTADDIINTVCQRYAVTLSELQGSYRGRDLVFARHLAMYLLRKHTHLTLTAIAKCMGRDDHTTVIHAMKSINNYLATNSFGRRDEILSFY